MSERGNQVFLFVIALGAVLSTFGVAVLGLTTLSLAIVVLSLFISIPLGLYLENKVNKVEEEKTRKLIEEYLSDLDNKP